MGNLCSKRKLKHSKAYTLEFQLDDVLENDREFKACQENVDFIQIGEVKDANNHLELYLNDVFEKECMFKAEQEEVEFIQTGIETLVQQIVDLVLEGCISKDKRCEDYPKVTNSETLPENISRIETFHEHLVERYFPIKTGDGYVKVRSTRCPIIKVGSFYEGTKNKFPDEFDFIFLLYSVAPQDPESYFEERNGHLPSIVWAHTCIKNTLTACNKESLKYVCPHGRLHRDRELYFDRYVDQHGPASMLRFIYNNGSMGERNINVDLVPAYKIHISQDLATYYFDSLSRNQETPKSFREELRSAKYYLRDRIYASFTETEVRFMKKVLSQKHVKVYMILKFLINGHGDGETLHTYQEVFGLGSGEIKGYSSYKIKTMMIHHHDECTNTNTVNIGPCVIQVLEAICQYDKTGTFPNLYKQNDIVNTYRFCLLPLLDVLTRKLRLLQISEDIYDYDNVRMKSVTRQYLSILDRAVPDMAEYLASLGDVNPDYYDWLHYLEMSKCRKCLKTC